MFKKKFQIKSVGETFTVGDCLRRRREESGLALREASRQLGIKFEYLDSLESGDYRNLPPQVYVRGFIKSYANFLGLDGGQLIKIYNRELNFAAEGEKKKISPRSPSHRLDLRQYLTITPRILTFAASLIVVSALGYYFLHQINSFNSKPYLFLKSPTADSVVREKDLVVSGQTEGDAILQINGQDISVNADGNFQQQITLSEGKNSLVVEARNRFNRTERREVNIVYEKPEEAKITIEESPTAGDAAQPLPLQIEEVTPEQTPAAADTKPQAADDTTPTSAQPDVSPAGMVESAVASASRSAAAAEIETGN